MVQVYIAPALGHLKLKTLGPDRVQRFYRQKLDALLSLASVREEKPEEARKNKVS